MKGLILAGGSGTRLYPMTRVMTKQLQPVYDKPMIYYPLSFLMLGGIREILMITTREDQPSFEKLLGDGSHLGISLKYQIQDQPNGLPEAFTLGEKFIDGQDCCLILGDNLFYGDYQFFRDALNAQKSKAQGRTGRVFAYSVADPTAYGVVEFDPKTRGVLSIEEKPAKPKSSFALPGLYLFDGTVAERTKKLKRSPRGETEITDLMKSYLSEDKLAVEMIGRGVAWLDTGTPRSLLDAASFICAIEERQGLKVACLEEVAHRMGFIDAQGFEKAIERLPNSSYRNYLKKIQSEMGSN